MVIYLSQLCLLEKQKIFKLTQIQAYYFWEERKQTGESGTELTDWLKAEEYVKETFPWLIKRSYWGTIVNEIGRNEEFPDVLICPILTCGVSLGIDEQPIEFGLQQCHCCGEIINVISARARL
jgi:hypothetical protein